MASRPNDENRGYDSSRFESPVDDNFHCGICLNVVKDARSCPSSEHIFCRDCIEEHLRVNAQRCPGCQDKLTVPLLRRALIVNNVVSELRIKCDYASRGCPEFTTVKDLQTHVQNCDFAPVLFSNEHCGEELNKRDRIHHETNEFQYRTMTCSDSKNIRVHFENLQRSLAAVDDKMTTLAQQNEVGIKQEMGAEFVEVNARIEKKFDALKYHQDEQRRNNQEIRKEMIESRKEMIQSKKEMKDVKQNLSAITKDVDEVKAMMMQILEKMNRIEQLVHKLPSPAEGMMNRQREDILIAGGLWESSAEIFSWKEEQWIQISPMNADHNRASSFIHNDQLFVVGGWASCYSIETLNPSQWPLTWKTFPGGFRYPWSSHQIVVHEQQMLHVGGYNDDEGKVSDLIGELQFTPSAQLKELGHMTEPKYNHGVEIVDDKVLIFGGQDEIGDVLSSVLEFDPKTNTCKEMPPLPQPLTVMATVRWRDQVLLLGGCDDANNDLNDALLYHPMTGKVSALPSMLEKRSGCCAVVTGDIVVVMGGRNDKRKQLDSVECFKMGSSSTWEYLPKMNHGRCEAVAQVLPSRRNYIQH